MSARYARERKHSALELLEKARHKAREIFDRQVYPPVVLTCSQCSPLQATSTFKPPGRALDQRGIE